MVSEIIYYELTARDMIDLFFMFTMYIELGILFALGIIRNKFKLVKKKW
jgi:hypothetical protein